MTSGDDTIAAGPVPVHHDRVRQRLFTGGSGSVRWWAVPRSPASASGPSAPGTWIGLLPPPARAARPGPGAWSRSPTRPADPPPVPARPRHGVADVVAAILGKDLPFGVAAYDGSRVGPHDPPATVVIRSPDALARILTRPGELGLSRAYVAGDLDVEGDIFAVLGLPVTPSDLRPNPVRVAELLRSAGPSVVRFLPHRPRSPVPGAPCTPRAGTGGPSATTTTSRTPSTSWSSDRP